MTVVDVERGLLDRLENLPAARANAALVLHVCDDPSASAATLGAAVLSDAFLTAKLLRLANSAYYGLSGEIREPTGAVRVLGFNSVRALALAQLTGALDASVVPSSFWDHTSRVGAACGMLADHFGVARSEAFAVGLLHDIGHAALLDLGLCVEVSADEEAEDIAGECLSFGTDHQIIGGFLCDRMRLPEAYADAIAHHHDPVPPDARAERRLLGAALRCIDAEAAAADDPALAALGVPAELAQQVSMAVDSQAAHIVAGICHS